MRQNNSGQVLEEPAPSILKDNNADEESITLEEKRLLDLDRDLRRLSAQGLVSLPLGEITA